jgi:UPF0755 protein
METKKLAGTILSVSVRTCIFALAVVFLYFFGRQAFSFGVAIFDEKGMDEEGKGYDVAILIPEDATNSDVAKILEENGLIDNKLLFSVQLKLSDYAESIVPGIYTLNTSMKPTEIMQIISPENKSEDKDE